MKWIAAPLLLFVPCSTVIAGECPAPGSVVELFGTISKDLHISMNLAFQNDGLSGSYAYVTHEKSIPLSGTCVGGSLTIRESGSSGKPAAFFQGGFTKPQTVEGTWSTPDGRKSLPFQLQALLPTDRVSGKYRMGNLLDKKSKTGAELNILMLDGGRVRVRGEALWIGNPQTGSVHTGEVDGTAKLEGDTAYYIESSSDPDSCRFTIRFSDRVIAVTDDNMQCGGMNVTFEGIYQRVGPPTFYAPSN
jgi:hypothetical protein